jgi:hypothetical protein
MEYGYRDTLVEMDLQSMKDKLVELAKIKAKKNSR